jgi:peptidoglycan/LPS O-acetylase OafA/YrhL
VSDLATVASDSQRPSRAGTGRVPYLDGLRAVAITGVLYAHARVSPGFPTWLRNASWANPIDSGALGVHLFFVISGFIITHLLILEERDTGTVSLRRFWIRRALRILPPFYIYALTIALINEVNPHLNIAPITFAMALTFLWEILSNHTSWWLGHTWSLSIEEQFYVLWPCAFLISLKRLRTIVIVAIAIPPFAAFSYMFFQGRAVWLLPVNSGYILAGCLLAVSRSMGYSGSARFSTIGVLVLVLLCILIPDYFTSRGSLGFLTIPFGSIVAGLGIALFLDALLDGRFPLVAHTLDARCLRWVGRASYSIYLWQQLFLGPHGFSWCQRFPQNILFALLAGAFGYYFIERLCIRMKLKFLAPDCIQMREQAPRCA